MCRRAWIVCLFGLVLWVWTVGCESGRQGEGGGEESAREVQGNVDASSVERLLEAVVEESPKERVEASESESRVESGAEAMVEAEDAGVSESPAESVAEMPIEFAVPESPWSADQCPKPSLVPVGTRVGEVLRDMTLYDCDGRAVKLTDFCGAKALWLSLHHTWCPHCRLLRDTMERIHTSYAGKNLASVAIVVQTNSRTRPDAQACKDWKQAGGLQSVLTLYDPQGVTSALWEQNYTALNVFVSGLRIITGKQHTDREADLRAQIDRALGP